MTTPTIWACVYCGTPTDVNIKVCMECFKNADATATRIEEQAKSLAAKMTHKEWIPLSHKELTEIIERHQQQIASDIITGGFGSIKNGLKSFYVEIMIVVREKNK